ncbi:hypothetical protein AB4144_62125, partial [Rhizobiaceae sp. 2RAB30]
MNRDDSIGSLAKQPRHAMPACGMFGRAESQALREVSCHEDRVRDRDAAVRRLDHQRGGRWMVDAGLD